MIHRIYILLVALVVSAGAYPSAAQTGSSRPYDNFVVVTAEEQAGRAGLEILERGGNAVDAAVAVQFALAVTLPRAGNIGGGGFMVLHLNDGSSMALDFREKAPERAERDMYLDESGEYVPELSREGALASGIPGTVDGMIAALERYGKFPLDVVMEPAIRLARDGYTLTHTHAEELNEAAEELMIYPSTKKYFVRDDGNDWQQGDLFVQTDLAQTLERIANHGREGFYSGLTARNIIEEIRRHGGIINYTDLQNYRSTWREPIRTEYENFELIMMPPPSSGGIVLKQALGMLKGYNLAEMGFNSADYIHLVSEVLRRSFADRNYYLGDPDFVDIPYGSLTENDYYQYRMSDYDASGASDSRNITHGRIEQVTEPTETTHFSIIDGDGNAVAVTTTLNGSFGSKLAVDGAGFLLNNEMDDFSAKPGEPNMFGLIGAEANAIEPGKRMLSSMSPVIVTSEGDVRMILGAAGGPRIITATLQNFLNLALFQMNSQQAVSAPRFHHQWLPDVISAEPFAISKDTEQILLGRGHEIGMMPEIGRSHIIYIDEHGFRYGASDPRGNGVVLGK